MSNRSKKIFLALSIVVPFLMYCMYYYGMRVKNAPYKFSEFESLTFKYGEGDSLVNQYYSKTGEFQYLNVGDSVVTTKVKLNKKDLLYLHRKAADLGFWNFPEKMHGAREAGKPQVRYYLELKYQRKTKYLEFDADYIGKPKLVEAAKMLIKEVDSRIKEAESRYN